MSGASDYGLASPVGASRSAGCEGTTAAAHHLGDFAHPGAKGNSSPNPAGPTAASSTSCTLIPASLPSEITETISALTADPTVTTGPCQQS